MNDLENGMVVEPLPHSPKEYCVDFSVRGSCYVTASSREEAEDMFNEMDSTDASDGIDWFTCEISDID